MELLLRVMAAAALSAAASSAISLPGYTTHAGVDITGANDTAFGGLCAGPSSAAFYGGASSGGRLWKVPTAVCDLVGCPRFGLRAGAPSKAGPYCIKGWVFNASVDSFISQKTCGGGIAATTVSGGCNDPDARYTLCPNGGGDTQLLARATGDAAAMANTCDANKQCVGFVGRRDGSGGVLLHYGYGGNAYTGYTTYTRIVVPSE